MYMILFLQVDAKVLKNDELRPVNKPSTWIHIEHACRPHMCRIWNMGKEVPKVVSNFPPPRKTHCPNKKETVVKEITR
jgi:hypothetical protein